MAKANTGTSRLGLVKTPLNSNPNAYDALVVQEGEPFQYDDKGRLTLNPPAIVAKFALERRMLFEPDESSFYEYDGATGLWRMRRDDEIKRELSRDLMAASNDLADSRLQAMRTSGRLVSLMTLLKAYVAQKNAFAEKRFIIQCQNGVLQLMDAPPKFLSFSPDYFARNATPIKYDPKATCPRFLNDLLGQVLSEEDISLIQRFGGAILMGRNAAQRLLLLTGTAGGGKSTLATIMERVIGLQNVAEIRSEHLRQRFELHAFVGKTLLTGKDVTADFLQQKGASKIKSLVGGDLLLCEKKRGAHFQIRGDYNLVVTSNSNIRVRLEGDAEAWERRILTIDYERPKPKQRVVDFADKLIEEEGSGILNFLVEGSLQHLDELKTHGDFQLSEAQRARTVKMLMASDSLRHFVEKRVRAIPTGDVTTEELVTAYYAYCTQCSWTPDAAHEVTKRLPSLILEIHRTLPSHDIKRDGKSRRGFRKLGIIAEER